MRLKIPVQTGNKALREGLLQKTMQTVFEQIRPEAAYFATDDGHRAGFVVFDLKDVTQIPAIAEPFFTNLDAQVDFSPVMNNEDLQKGLQNLPKR